MNDSVVGPDPHCRTLSSDDGDEHFWFKRHENGSWSSKYDYTRPGILENFNVTCRNVDTRHSVSFVVNSKYNVHSWKPIISLLSCVHACTARS